MDDILATNQLKVQALCPVHIGTGDILRSIDGGYEVVRAKLPILLTVTATANEPRPPKAKRILQYRHHTCPAEITNRVRKQLEARGREPSEAEMAEAVNPLVTAAVKQERMLTIWDADAVGADHEKIGGRGSPTKVKKIESVVFKGRDLKWVEATEDGAKGLMKELVAEHILG